MSTELRKNGKKDLKKDFFKFMYNVVFEKSMTNVRKYRVPSL